MSGIMVAGVDRGALGATVEGEEGSAWPYVLVIIKEAEHSLQVRLSPEATLRFAQGLVPLSETCNALRVAKEAGLPPRPGIDYWKQRNPLEDDQE